MSELPTPTDYELRAAMVAIIAAADAAALVYSDWKIELVEGRSLNAARNEEGGEPGMVHAAMMTQRHSPRERVGDVPYEPSKTSGTKFAVLTARVYEFRFFRRYDDVPEVVTVGEGEEAEEVSKSTEQLFNEWLDRVVDGFSKAPRLGLNARVERHDELQVSNRRVPSYGGEYAHTADALLTVHLHETVTAT
jgi:hypothetical protein